MVDTLENGVSALEGKQLMGVSLFCPDFTITT